MQTVQRRGEAADNPRCLCFFCFFFTWPVSRCFVFLGAEICIMFRMAWLSFRLLWRRNSVERCVMTILCFEGVSDINFNVRCRNVLNGFVKTWETWVSVFFFWILCRGKKPEKTVFSKISVFFFFFEPLHHYSWRSISRNTRKIPAAFHLSQFTKRKTIPTKCRDGNNCSTSLWRVGSKTIHFRYFFVIVLYDAV